MQGAPPGSGRLHVHGCHHQKMISRTGEIRRWARAILITLDLLARLWGVYVRSSALWCASSCRPNASQQLSLARARRKAARLLLGHRCTSPLPTPCIEMGWPLINTWLQYGRLRLLAMPASWRQRVCALPAPDGRLCLSPLLTRLLRPTQSNSLWSRLHTRSLPPTLLECCARKAFWASSE